MKNYSDEQFFDAPFRGVTSILSAIFGNKLEKTDIPDYIIKAASERGTAVHKYIENWLHWYDTHDGDEPHLDLEYTIYETNFKEWLEERISWDIKPLYTEHKIINKKLGAKGIIDCIAIVNGKYCMIDWKTSSNLDEWSTECQLQLYYMLLSKGSKSEREIAKKIEELRCLSLTKTGYRWFKFNIDKKLGNAILELWNKHFREIAEAEKLKEKKPATRRTIIL